MPALNFSSATLPVACTINLPYPGTAIVLFTACIHAASRAGAATESNGVTGLSSTLATYTPASKAGNLVYNISGTPASTGAASLDTQ